MINRFNPILLLVLTLCLISVYLPPEANGQKKDNIIVSSPKNESKSKRLSFRRIMSERGEKDGVLTSGHLYISDDGIKVLRVGEVYRSPSLATASMNIQLRDAMTIIDRSDIVENKRKVGERVVAEFSHNRQEPSSFVILKTHDQLLVKIESVSLRHILAFEMFERERL